MNSAAIHRLTPVLPTASATPAERFVYGGGGELLQSRLPSIYYFYRDALGSTSHLADSAGAMKECYTYDLYGNPTFYDATGVARVPNATAYGINHLFTAQRWYSQISLYDLRNRFLKPDWGRFLQPDPIGFAGDPANLYRYCANNPVNWSDPYGLNGGDKPLKKHREGATVTVDRINVDGGTFGVSRQGSGGSIFGSPAGNGNAGEGRLSAIDRNGNVYNPKRNGLGVDGDTTDQVVVNVGPVHDTTAGGSGGSPLGSPGFDSREPFTIDPTMLAKYGKGFDRPGLEQLARVTNGFGIGVSVVVALPVAVPLALDGLYYGGWYGGAAATAAYQAALAHPGAVSQFGQAFNAFITPGGVPTNYASLIGQGANTIVNIYDPTFGP